MYNRIIISYKRSIRNISEKILQEIDFGNFTAGYGEFVRARKKSAFARIDECDDERSIFQAIAYFDKIAEKGLEVKVFHRVRYASLRAVVVMTVEAFKKDVGDEFVDVNVIASALKVTADFHKSVLAKTNLAHALSCHCVVKSVAYSQAVFIAVYLVANQREERSIVVEIVKYADVSFTVVELGEYREQLPLGNWRDLEVAIYYFRRHVYVINLVFGFDDDFVSFFAFATYAVRAIIGTFDKVLNIRYLVHADRFFDGAEFDYIVLAVFDKTQLVRTRNFVVAGVGHRSVRVVERYVLHTKIFADFGSVAVASNSVDKDNALWFVKKESCHIINLPFIICRARKKNEKGVAILRRLDCMSKYFIR